MKPDSEDIQDGKSELVSSVVQERVERFERHVKNRQAERHTRLSEGEILAYLELLKCGLTHDQKLSLCRAVASSIISILEDEFRCEETEEESVLVDKLEVEGIEELCSNVTELKYSTAGLEIRHDAVGWTAGTT